MEVLYSFGIVCFAGLFLLAFIGVFAAIAIVSTQAKQRSANRILKAQAEGAFADLETPKNKLRFRFLAGIALFGVSGMTCSITTFVIDMATRFANRDWAPLLVALIFGSIGAVAGFLMQREINHRS